MMEEERKRSFKESLDQHYSWPALYTFKFIVPKESKEELVLLFSSHHISEKESAGGKYVSITVSMMSPSSEAVVAVYESTRNIKGLIAL